MKKRISLSAIIGLAVLCSSAHAQTIPGDVASAGLTYVVPDVLVWYNGNHLPGHPYNGYATFGPITNLAAVTNSTTTTSTAQVDPTAFGNDHFEAHVSRLGDSTFLIGAATLCDDGSWDGSTNWQGDGYINPGPEPSPLPGEYPVIGGSKNGSCPYYHAFPNEANILIFQPASGGTPVLDSAFYDDAGNPYRLHEMMRQKNPESCHVGGDKRPGGTNFMVACMSSLWYAQLWTGSNHFNTDGRFATNLPLYATGYPSGANSDQGCYPYDAPWCSGNPNIATDFPSGFMDVDASCVQAFALDPATLKRTMVSKAAIGPYRNVTNLVPVCICNQILGGNSSACPSGLSSCPSDLGTNKDTRSNNWLGYLGNVTALDNGNFVNVVGDPTAFFNTNSAVDPEAVGRQDPVATIFAPDGGLVKDSWFVGTNVTGFSYTTNYTYVTNSSTGVITTNVSSVVTNDVVSQGGEGLDMNIAAYSGGFCIRNYNFFYFYDDNGSYQRGFDLRTNNPAGFAIDRGDHTRIQSDIRSHYVYMVGNVGDNYQLGIWDTRTGKFLTNVVVNSDIGTLKNDGGGDDGGGNCELGVDELDRVCVAFEGTPAAAGSDWGSGQVMARVMQWDGKNLTWLTPTFFPFLNSDNAVTTAANAGFAQGFITAHPGVAMTKDYICIVGKGLVNSTNNPSATPDTAQGTILYTVITAPVHIPGAAEVGLTNIVPDMLLWYSTNNYYTNGPEILSAALPDSTIWEPYSCVLGDSTFLIANVTYANDYPQESGSPPEGNDDLTFALALQPAVGGSPKLSWEFYADNGTAYNGPISARKTGPPGRVRADKRYGAVNFITAANCMAGNPVWTGASFQSNDRWTNAAYSGGSRAAVEQIFSLNPPTLAQTPQTLASDFSGEPPTMGQTTFGDLVALDNGNFAIVTSDASGDLTGSANITATVAIVEPNGNVVTPAFQVDPTITASVDIWANCTSYRGGFCVRYNATLYFFNNAGVLQGTSPQSTSGINFNTGRGDNMRIASDIHSHYVYVAGANEVPGAAVASTIPTTNSPIVVAIWDANTQQFITSADVSSDLAPQGMVVDRVDVAVDALDRLTVVWDCLPSPAFYAEPINPASGNPTGEPCYQTVARVMAFDGKSISYLTPSFFPFVNHDTSGLLTAQGLATFEPIVAMTPRQILISCKGCVNSTNNPAAGPDTPLLTSSSLGTDLYTIIPHPAPMAAPIPVMTATTSITLSATNLVVSWNADDGLFTVQTTPQVKSSGTVWTSVTAGNVAPPVSVPITSANKFVRLIRNF
jgi:hypothetical protein